MIEPDVKQFEQNMSLIQSALKASAGRAVRSMAFNKKDRTLDALAKYIDKPAPFTMRKSAYQATPPRMKGDDMVADFNVRPLQAAYLFPYVFASGTRRPGDPGAPKNRVWLPIFPTENSEA